MRNLPPIRTKAVPWLALVLGVVAIAAIALLAHRTHASRHSELTLLTVKVELDQLQTAPFRANAQTGGSPALAARLLRTGKGSIDAQLRELRGQSSPPAALRSMQAPLRANFATLDQIYAVGITKAGYDNRADRLSAVASASAATIERLLDAGGRDYERRAVRAQNQAGVGSAAVILLLLLAFGVYYRRAIRARAIAGDLAQENQRLLAASRKEALTDALTGLGNRRALVNDLDAELPRADAEHPRMLALFDLDGFKQYNDSFGHPAGDALLVRLGENLRRAMADRGSAYRMGGDEFCILATLGEEGPERIASTAAAALHEEGEGFTISCAYGAVIVPDDAADADEAIRLADHRMYVQKNGGRTSASRQSTDVLLQALQERNPDLGTHLDDVGRLAQHTALKLGLPHDRAEQVRTTGELHDVGKVAIPDAILNKPGPLNDSEWEFVRRHSEIGERIVAAAPALGEVAPLVRSTHERFDGSGYPDGLAAHEIPLAARIVAVCDAYDAMITQRPYQRAMDPAAALQELRRCAGTQFDPDVVDAFGLVLLDDAALLPHTTARHAASSATPLAVTTAVAQRSATPPPGELSEKHNSLT